MTPSSPVTPERVAAARAEIERRKALAESATPGPWEWSIPAGDDCWPYVPTLPLSNHDIQDEDDRGWNADADRQHIAACDPSFMLRVYDGHLGVLDRHARSVFDETELYDICVCKEDHDGDCSPIVHDICVPCSCGQEKGLGCREVAWPCPEIAAVVVLYRPVPESVTSGGETP